MQLVQEFFPQHLHDLRTVATNEGDLKLRTPEELAGIVAAFAAYPGWFERVRLRTDQRWYERLHHSADHDIWAISWMPGQSTGFHDHGESAGAFIVKTGTLEEHRPGSSLRTLLPGEISAFDSDYAHDVRNNSLAPAITIHAYSPPLEEMNEYELNGNDLVPRAQASERAQNLDQHKPRSVDRGEHGNIPAGIDQVLAAARARLQRMDPEDAQRAVLEGGAILVDIRPEAQRGTEGSIPGALIIERNVLEWRLDPSSSARLAIATSHDLQVIVFCSEGYTSSLAAAALQDLGLWRATDMIGGFRAWEMGGSPTIAPANLSSTECLR